MQQLAIRNPFNAPVYHEETVSSTMDVSGELASSGSVHGTVIVADFQEAGRGRIKDRRWEMDRGLNLPFTVLLRYPAIGDIPAALTLRVGLAVSLAIEDFVPELKNTVLVKWPNDIMIGTKKAAGIYCKAEEEINKNITTEHTEPNTMAAIPSCCVYVGIGINVAQREFNSELRNKATSISLAVNRDIDALKRFLLLEEVLVRLYDEFEVSKEDWNIGREQSTSFIYLTQRLYKKDQQVSFIEGAAIEDAARERKAISGKLIGIDIQGQLLIETEGRLKAFSTGELIVYK